MSGILARIDRIKKTAPAPKKRALQGEWVAPAWVVKGLVEREGYGVTDAVKLVVQDESHSPEDRAVRGIRHAYYKIKNLPWSDCPESTEEAEPTPA